jgi:hypothetical protein
MKRSRFSVLFLIAATSANIHNAAGQAINAPMQNAAVRVVTTRAAPAPKPIANIAVAPQVAPRLTAPQVAPQPATFSSRSISSYTPRILQQQPTIVQRKYLPDVHTVNPRFAALTMQQTAPVREQPITLDPTTREREFRTLAAMRERRDFGTDNQRLAAINARQPVMTHEPATRPQLETRESPKDLTTTKKLSNKENHLGYGDACRRHWHEWHDRNWWHNNCNRIIFVTSGYYFLDGSYWYPAWGYDPLQTYYDYDGPIYTYGDLLPDEVIANVQTALQDTGYYAGPITGSLDVGTRAALANFQRDYGLSITGAIDEPTVETLGLNQSSSEFITQ